MLGGLHRASPNGLEGRVFEIERFGESLATQYGVTESNK
ncbi:unnamed protein product, partial [marine sediment metagenome]